MTSPSPSERNTPFTDEAKDTFQFYRPSFVHTYTPTDVRVYASLFFIPIHTSKTDPSHGRTFSLSISKCSQRKRKQRFERQKKKKAAESAMPNGGIKDDSRGKCVLRNEREGDLRYASKALQATRSQRGTRGRLAKP